MVALLPQGQLCGYGPGLRRMNSMSMLQIYLGLCQAVSLRSRPVYL
eukprot:COSAG03_NODE_178_length_11063_cov_43.316951_16_plen_45_part_01